MAAGPRTTTWTRCAVADLLQMPALQLDGNGLPRGHYDAMDIAAQTLRQWVNDLPESVYFLNRTDAEDVADVMIRAYLTTVKREQR
jgi:hypothetical protein